MARQTGDRVTWSWGDGTAEGRITQIYTERVEKMIKNSKIVRKATPDNPAYLIEQDDGDRVLKLGSELD
ncbi:DUF2945 domain-containing protein [Salinisphaera sp. T31B1]|uniref:DUF2945 domain-containing protein n=1 Tax=Salinisphaera sp. T31B1 TaxID=727963 RepID=UPI0033405A2E